MIDLIASLNIHNEQRSKNEETFDEEEVNVDDDRNKVKRKKIEIEPEVKTTEVKVIQNDCLQR